MKVIQEDQGSKSYNHNDSQNRTFQIAVWEVYILSNPEDERNIAGKKARNKINLERSWDRAIEKRNKIRRVIL